MIGGTRLFALACLLIPGIVHGLDSLQLKLGALQGPDWSTESVEISLALNAAEGDAFSLSGRSLKHPALPFTLKHFSIDCPKGQISDVSIRCDAGRLTSKPALLARPRSGFAFVLNRQTQDLILRFPNLELAEGRLKARFRQRSDRWHLDLTGQSLNIASLQTWLTRWQLPAIPLEQASGELQLKTTLKGRGNQLRTATADMDLKNAGFQTADGLQAGEGLRLKLKADAQNKRAGWQSTLQVSADDGQLYVDPVFVDLKELPASLETALHWPANPEKGMSLNAAKLDWRGIGEFSTERLTLDKSLTKVSAEMQIDKTYISNSYEYLLKPFLDEGLATELDTEGSLSGHIVLKDSRPTAVDLSLQAGQVSDRQGRLALYDLNGPLRWRSDGESSSRLAFSGGNLFAFDFGGAQLELLSTPDAVNLQRPLRLPVFDGALVVDRFEYGYARETKDWLVEGFLQPVSIAKVVNVLGWPPMEGRLTGMVPAVRGREGRIEVDGTLLIQAFKGDLTVRNLVIEEPFGLVPRLQADVELRKLDLETLTRTFSFGRISGLLEGEMKGLQLVNWQPEAFDARFATPEDDETEHRISQRAVDNLSSLGGGATGLFSRGFLSFIEEFRYDQLGLSCRLLNGVCRMDGVAPKGEGYFIVEGGGIPRIDVVGYARNVDWQTLVERLRNISLNDSPIIE